MSFKKIRILVGIGAVLIFVGCQQASVNSITPIEDPSDTPEQLVLGKKLENPYSVSSMMRARDSLVARGTLAKLSVTDEDLSATHYYIRFKPKTEAQLIDLKKDPTLVLWDYPLDYEILKGGTGYRDPEIAKGDPIYQYTAVDVKKPLPSIEYEILEKLILDPKSENSILAKRAVSGFYSMLEQEALRITGNLSTSENSLAKKVAGKWRPTGSIQVTDDVLKKNMPVVQVNVRVRNWFLWWDGYTDNNGNFSSSEEYNGDVSYSLRWQYPDNKFDVRDGTFGQAFYNGPSNKRGAWNLVISSGMSWVYAHIFRAGRFYIAEEPWNLGAPFNHISIGAYDEDGRAYHMYPALFFTDIRIYRTYSGSTRTAKDLFRTTCHELAHAHHREIRGNATWSDIDNKIQEGWAVGIGQFMEDRIYSNKSFWQEVSFTWMKGDGEKKYTPIVIDLIDVLNQRIYGTDYPIDKVSGYTLEQIQNSLKDQTSWSSWRDKIKSISNPTNGSVDELFNQYNNL